MAAAVGVPLSCSDEFDARHAGHTDVEKQAPRRVVFEVIEVGFGRVVTRCFPTAATEHEGEGIADHGFVIDDADEGFFLQLSGHVSSSSDSVQ